MKTKGKKLTSVKSAPVRDNPTREYFCNLGGHLFMFQECIKQEYRLGICKQCRDYFLFNLDSDIPIKDLTQDSYFKMLV